MSKCHQVIDKDYEELCEDIKQTRRKVMCSAYDRQKAEGGDIGSLMTEEWDKVKGKCKVVVKKKRVKEPESEGD